MAGSGGQSLHARCDWLCRLDPPKREHFGDGKFVVRWGGGDFAQYQQARQPQIQQLVQSLEAEGRPKSASRVRRAVAAGCPAVAVSRCASLKAVERLGYAFRHKAHLWVSCTYCISAVPA